MTAPAVPSEEEIKAIIANGCGCDRDCEKHGLDACGCRIDAQAIIALFAPILAEKEREIRQLKLEIGELEATSRISIACWRDKANEMEARALAAEAALAGRGRRTGLCEQPMIRASKSGVSMQQPYGRRGSS